VASRTTTPMRPTTPKSYRWTASASNPQPGLTSSVGLHIF
jgi:hypothetical protein